MGKKKNEPTVRHFTATHDLIEQRAISNTLKRELAKLGWASVREVKVLESHVQRKILTARPTPAGRAALAAAADTTTPAAP